MSKGITWELYWVWGWGLGLQNLKVLSLAGNPPYAQFEC